MSKGRLEQALILLWRAYCSHTQRLAIFEQPKTSVESVKSRFTVMGGYSLVEVVAFIEGRWSGKGR